MNMCGLHTETLFNARFLDIPEFCVNTHTHILFKDSLPSYNSAYVHDISWASPVFGQGKPTWCLNASRISLI